MWGSEFRLIAERRPEEIILLWGLEELERASIVW
jgi:hypothetical protein